MRSEKRDVEGAVPYKWELRCPKQIKYSELAQLAEHLTVNQVVAGSSPAFGAKRTPKRCPFLLASNAGLSFSYCLLNIWALSKMS